MPYTPTPGEYVKLRNGEKAYVAAVLENPMGESDFCIVGYIGESFEYWTKTGAYAAHGREHPHDIIGPWREPRTGGGFLFLDSSGDENFFCSLEDAKGAARIGGCIASLKVVLVEGECCPELPEIK